MYNEWLYFCSGKLIELVAGKSAAEFGLSFDSTPFKFSDENPAVDFFGKILEKGETITCTCTFVTLLNALSNIGEKTNHLDIISTFCDLLVEASLFFLSFCFLSCVLSFSLCMICFSV